MQPTAAEKKSFVVFLFLLLMLAAYLLKSFAMPAILAAILVILCNPIQAFLLKKLKERRYLSATISTLVVFLFVLVPLILVGSLVTSQIFSWADKLSFYLENESLSKLFANLSINISNYFNQLNTQFNLNLDLSRMAKGLLKQIWAFASAYSPGVLSSTLNVLVSFFIMLVVIFFFFADGPKLYKEIVLLSPLQEKYEHILAYEIKRTIHGVFYGSFFTALVQAILATAAYFFLKVDGFLVWGFITFLTSFIPFVGAAGIWLPMSIILLLVGDTRSGIFLIIYGALIISGVDNFLKPILIKGKSDLHPLVLFLSILGGIRVFGPAGLLLGPIIMAVLLAALKIYKQDFVQSN
ncbi:MAG: AI-2E family transporter [Deltaproteobacteria bacterium]|nr:AI-2E family transporter [Deltaproteobacteria bacterium]